MIYGSCYMADLLRWLIPWEFSIAVVTAICLAAVLYRRGSRKILPSPARRTAFWLGLALLYGASHTQLDYYSEHVFFMHRIQHSVLHHIGPFLMMLSRPGEVLAAGMPDLWHKKIHSRLDGWPLPRLARLCNHPVIAPLLFCGFIGFWLIPTVHFIAMLDWRLYRIMNASMVINGLMFWGLTLNAYSLRPSLWSPGTRIAMMLAIIPPQIVMGLLIFAAPYEIYPLYSLCGRAFTISPLADQQIGGLILWIPAAMMSVTGILLVIRREWMLPKEESLRLLM